MLHVKTSESLPQQDNFLFIIHLLKVIQGKQVKTYWSKLRVYANYF